MHLPVEKLRELGDVTAVTENDTKSSTVVEKPRDAKSKSSLCGNALTSKKLRNLAVSRNSGLHAAIPPPPPCPPMSTFVQPLPSSAHYGRPLHIVTLQHSVPVIRCQYL